MWRTDDHDSVVMMIEGGGGCKVIGPLQIGQSPGPTAPTAALVACREPSTLHRSE